MNSTPNRGGSNDLVPYYFHRGESCRAYEYLGAHRVGDFWFFRVFAPDAESVAVVGDFCDWRTDAYPMEKRTSAGVWEKMLPAATVREGMKYKFYLRAGKEGRYKADPYAFRTQNPPESASVIPDLTGYEWRDGGWLRYRAEHFTHERAGEQAISVYELHPGTWKRHADGSPLSYTELADDLAPYVKQMGFTHVELTPMGETSDDASLGYRCAAYFAPTARYGSPHDFRNFVDKMHEAGIGVLLDWCPAYFPTDEAGLCEFDGKPLYEYSDPSRAVLPWDARRFDFSRPEVRSFLFSAAVFWADEYHVDGFCANSVASALCLDYGKRAGEWTPNRFGDRRCLEAISFFHDLHIHLARQCPGVISVCDAVGDWRGVTDTEGGDALGFTFCRESGRALGMPEALCDPAKRGLSKEWTPARREREMLSVFHDGLRDGRGSLLCRMPGEGDERFAPMRAYAVWLLTAPGKKTLCMGCEIGRLAVWNGKDPVEWELTDLASHERFQRFFAECNHFYLSSPALWEREDATGASRESGGVLSFFRGSADAGLTVAVNLTGERKGEYLLAVPADGTYEEVFNSDRQEYGGSGDCNAGRLRASRSYLPGAAAGIRVSLAPYGAAVFRKAAEKNFEARGYGTGISVCKF